MGGELMLIVIQNLIGAPTDQGVSNAQDLQRGCGIQGVLDGVSEEALELFGSARSGYTNAECPEFLNNTFKSAITAEARD